jgi:hypothetical protein
MPLSCGPPATAAGCHPVRAGAVGADGARRAASQPNTLAGSDERGRYDDTRATSQLTQSLRGSRTLGGSRTSCTGPRCDLRRRRLHRAQRQPPPGDGQPAQPRLKRTSQHYDGALGYRRGPRVGDVALRGPAPASWRVHVGSCPDRRLLCVCSGSQVGTKVQRDERRGRDQRGDDEDSGTEAVRCGSS